MKFKSKGVVHESFKDIELTDGTIIGIFQGDKGVRPDFDMRICYKDKFTKGPKRTPKHLHWVVDLLIKKEHNKELTMKFIKYLKEYWESLDGIKTKEEQQNIEKKLSSKQDISEFEALNNYGELSVEFIAYIIELFSIEEKTGYEGAFMFRNLLDALISEKDIFSIISLASYNGR